MTSVTSVTSGKITNFVEKNAIENVYFFFTYEQCRRRLPLIKMINGVEEVFVLLSPRRITTTCFGSTVFRVSKVRLFKDSIGLLAHDKKKDGKPKKNWRKNVSTKMFRVYMGFKVWEYHLSTNAVRRQYSQIFKVKIYSGTDNFQTTKRQFGLHIYPLRLLKYSTVGFKKN